MTPGESALLAAPSVGALLHHEEARRALIATAPEDRGDLIGAATAGRSNPHVILALLHSPPRI